MGGFQKDIRDFFADTTRLATAEDIEPLGLDPRYVGFQLATKINSGNARIRGIELSLRHSLAPLGSWARPFSVFANASRLTLQGSQGADFSGFMPKSAAWGVTFSRSRLTVMGKWNWRDLQRNAPFAALGPDAYAYLGARTHLDVNLDYQLHRRFGLFFSIRNVFNVPNEALRYGSQTPAYARMFMVSEFGAQVTAGVKGGF